jgi:hypothetical protein
MKSHVRPAWEYWRLDFDHQDAVVCKTQCRNYCLVGTEFQKLWRSVTVDSMDEEKIEEYLKRQGISSMQESGPKKVVCNLYTNSVISVLWTAYHSLLWRAVSDWFPLPGCFVTNPVIWPDAIQILSYVLSEASTPALRCGSPAWESFSMISAAHPNSASSWAPAIPLCSGVSVLSTSYLWPSVHIVPVSKRNHIATCLPINTLIGLPPLPCFAVSYLVLGGAEFLIM